MPKIVLLDKVSKKDARAFGAFLMGSAPGPGVPENPDPTKAMLKRDAEGRVIAQYKSVTLGRAVLDPKTGKPAVEIADVTPEKSHGGVIGMFDKAYAAWAEHALDTINPEILERVKQLLDPPKNGAPEVTLEAVSRAELEILSLKDVLRKVLPEGVELAKFERNEHRIRVYYELSDSGVQVPLMTAWHTEKSGTVMRSGDGKSPAPVGFFLKLLEEAKRYNTAVAGPKRLKEASGGITEDTSDPEVMAAFARYLATGSEVKVVSVNDCVEVALSPKTHSVIAYIDRKMIAQSRVVPETENWDTWVRPGYGWSSRAEFAQRAFVAGGRKMIAEKLIDTGLGEEWASDIEAALG